jgi:hypothetical protein
MQRKSGIVRLGMILALILIMSGLAGSSGAWASNQSPDQAMRAFIDAMVRKDASAVLSFFPRTSSWQYLAYEIGTGKLVTLKTTSVGEMRHDFAKKLGWYGFFFPIDTPGYTFQVNFLDGKMWKMRGPNIFVAPNSDDGRPSITWKQEGERWVIEKIAETTT